MLGTPGCDLEIYLCLLPGLSLDQMNLALSL
jgi:hypothetical protein